ncbi:pilus assembly protein N-terminal domain-containing protein [Stigmatella hybrida]|uniref:pilus assembly protein N-terminal domain-containing protein n=1 Tax=Stigmatella hybrida TaxID=394097 RepID=UPI001CDA6254|nr:pilus assembly protein N-terminal domain-containing protein [Stigmatella hybrida]
MSAPAPFAARLRAGWLAALLCLPVPALAWPVDMRFSLESGGDRFHKLSAVDWVEVEDPAIATAEVLSGSNELLLTGKRPGRTLLLLYAEGKFAVWQLTVSEPGARPAGPASPELLAAARKACPGLEAKEAPERLLTVTVKDAACRTALLPLFQGDTWLARELELTFELPVLQAQLAAMGPRLKALGLEARYSGAGLVLQGTASAEAHRRALWELFRQSVGRVALEDRVKVEPPEAPPEGQDAGTPDAGPRAR